MEVRTDASSSVVAQNASDHASLPAAECDGRCRSRHHAHASRCRAVHREPHPSTGSAVVLTVAHLDHQPENCDPANLMAMCQACHLAYDRDHHADTRRARQEQ